MRPIIEHHDRSQFDVFCYSGVTQPDATTEFFRSCVATGGGWRDTYALTDQQFAELVRRDRIDILIDLTLHMAHNRLLAFARKPAPVQATYLGYPHTTGLEAMDYKISDVHLDPEGLTERFHTERIIRLPETFFCCSPESDAPPVGALPARSSGFVTFISLNTLMKTSPPCVEAWARILRDTPGSRLMLVAGGLGGAQTQQRVRDRFARHGIDADRLEMLELRGVAGGWDALARADVALDCFPYSGGTTTANCLWMGVPVVTLAGQSPVGRQGVSFNSNVGLAELIAPDADEYVRVAVNLANDLDRLATIRAELRPRMADSAITDGPRFVRNLEAAYRSMWTAWCAS
jgi:predicted O-linked N-acetylglucosamine transferase (SPINDLY family)